MVVPIDPHPAAAQGSPAASRSPQGFDARHTLALAIAAAGIFVWLARDQPKLPHLSSDSASYLEFSPVRPHGYSLFLAAYRRLAFDDLAYLPGVQLALYLAAVLLLAVAIGRRTRSFPAAAATRLVACGLTDTSHFTWVLSDGIYAVALTTAAACLVIYGEGRKISWLLLASAALGTAIALRAIGLALLPAFLIAAVVAAVERGRRPLSTVIVAMVPAAVICCSAAASQLAHHGRFVVAGASGMDMLGKLPLLSHTLSDDSPWARLNDVIETMQSAREKLGRADDPSLEALIAWQYYEYLRWFVIVPGLEDSWALWREADDYERGRLATALVTAYAVADPAGLFHRTLIDFWGLWTMPRWHTQSEHRSTTTALARLGVLPYLTAFAETAEGKLVYYKILIDPSPQLWVFAFRLTIAAFWCACACLLAALAARRWRGAARSVPDLWFIVLGVHGAYLGTALMEGAYERYIMPTWPLVAAAPILAVALLVEGRSGNRDPHTLASG